MSPPARPETRAARHDGIQQGHEAIPGHSARPVERSALSGDRPARAFSGWSELFAVVHKLTLEGATASSHRTVTSHREHPLSV